MDCSKDHTRPDSSHSSPLLLLPRELRLRIYELLLPTYRDPRTVLIQFVLFHCGPQGFFRVESVFDLVSIYMVKSTFPSIYPQSNGSDIAAQPLTYRSSESSQNAELAILSTCRQLFHEAAPLLYNQHLFMFNNPMDLYVFVDIINTTCSTGMRSISLLINCSRSNPIPHLRRASEIVGDRLSRLQALTVYVDFTQAERQEMREVEAGLLDLFRHSPIQKARVGIIDDGKSSGHENGHSASDGDKEPRAVRLAWAGELEKKLVQHNRDDAARDEASA